MFVTAQLLAFLFKARGHLLLIPRHVLREQLELKLPILAMVVKN
jgi:hypothetical protein